MKYLCLILLVFSAIFFSCSTERTSEVPKIPVEVIHAPENTIENNPPILVTLPAYYDADCKRNVGAEFANMVRTSIANKENILKKNPSNYYWQAFFKALAKAESCLNVTEQYKEKGLGKDAVTGLNNTSEGLFQLSYQDAKYHGCNFVYLTDKKLSVKDVTKTIFNQQNQIECAAIILNKQLKSKSLYSRFYWAVLDTNDNRHKEFLKYLKSEGY